LEAALFGAIAGMVLGAIIGWFLELIDRHYGGGSVLDFGHLPMLISAIIGALPGAITGMIVRLTDVRWVPAALIGAVCACVTIILIGFTPSEWIILAYAGGNALIGVIVARVFNA
jgi:hypothetical protein